MTLKDLYTLKFKKPPTVAIYRKTTRGKKYYMLVTLKSVDIVNNPRAKKPMIDHKYEITELGVGEIFIERWMHKHKINTFDFVE